VTEISPSGNRSMAHSPSGTCKSRTIEVAKFRFAFPLKTMKSFITNCARQPGCVVAAGRSVLLETEAGFHLPRRAAFAPSFPSAVRVFFGRCAIVLARFAARAAFLIFFFAAMRCFLLVIAKIFRAGRGWRTSRCHNRTQIGLWERRQIAHGQPAMASQPPANVSAKGAA